MKVLFIAVDAIPNNCSECICQNCHYPLKAYPHDTEILKKYHKKRHEMCPLKLVKEEKE